VAGHDHPHPTIHDEWLTVQAPHTLGTCPAPTECLPRGPVRPAPVRLGMRTELGLDAEVTATRKAGGPLPICIDLHHPRRAVCRAHLDWTRRDCPSLRGEAAFPDSSQTQPTAWVAKKRSLRMGHLQRLCRWASPAFVWLRDGCTALILGKAVTSWPWSMMWKPRAQASSLSWMPQQSALLQPLAQTGRAHCQWPDRVRPPDGRRAQSRQVDQSGERQRAGAPRAPQFLLLSPRFNGVGARTRPTDAAGHARGSDGPSIAPREATFGPIRDARGDLPGDHPFMQPERGDRRTDTLPLVVNCL